MAIDAKWLKEFRQDIELLRQFTDRQWRSRLGRDERTGTDFRHINSRL